jgi:putative membrane protein
MNTLTLLAGTAGDGHHGWWVVAALVGRGDRGLVWFFTCRRRPGERSGADRARDILAERFARGELSVEEYRERLAQL